MSPVSIRLAEPDDLARIHGISANAASDLVEKHGHGHWGVISTRKTLKRATQEASLYVIAQDGLTVGTFRLTNNKIVFYRKAWFARPDDLAAYLLNMAIDPAYQRQGIGQVAMREIDQRVRDMNLLALRFDAYAGPAGAGIFYQKCGYMLVHKGCVGDVALEYYEKTF